MDIQVNELEAVHVLDKLPLKPQPLVHRIAKFQSIRGRVVELQDLLIVGHIGLCFGIEGQQADRIDRQCQ